MSLSMENIIKGLKEVTRKTIQAIGLSSDQVKEVAMGMKSYLGLKELDLDGGAQGHVGHSSISAVLPQHFLTNSEDQHVKRQSHSRASRLPLLLLELWWRDHCP